MTTININVQATLQWVAKPLERTGRWMAVCDPLGIAIEAETLEELRSLMGESTHLLFRDLLKENEFDQFLRDRGWTAAQPPEPANEDVSFSVPMELVMAKAGARGPKQLAH